MKTYVIATFPEGRELSPAIDASSPDEAIALYHMALRLQGGADVGIARVGQDVFRLVDGPAIQAMEVAP